MEILEITGVEAGEIVLNPLFTLEEGKNKTKILQKRNALQNTVKWNAD